LEPVNIHISCLEQSSYQKAQSQEIKVSPRPRRRRVLFWNEKPRIKKTHRRNLFYHNNIEFVDTSIY
jgi:hypothetical protein